MQKTKKKISKNEENLQAGRAYLHKNVLFDMLDGHIYKGDGQ